MSEDSWKHRSEGMKCKTCMWYVSKQPTVYVFAGDSGKVLDEMKPGEMRTLKKDEEVMTPIRRDIGRCRRHAPTMNGYPVVFKFDWCGDHRVDENKI